MFDFSQLQQPDSPLVAPFSAPTTPALFLAAESAPPFADQEADQGDVRGAIQEQPVPPPVALVVAPAPQPTTGLRTRRPVTKADLEAFRSGFAWLRPRLGRLLQAGWTRPELFRRNLAQRGIAWLAVWADPTVTATLTPAGFIAFAIAGAAGIISQTARPKAWHRETFAKRGTDHAA